MPEYDQKYYDDWAKELHSQYIADRRATRFFADVEDAHNEALTIVTEDTLARTSAVNPMNTRALLSQRPELLYDTEERTPEQDNAEYLGEVPWSDRVDE